MMQNLDSSGTLLRVWRGLGLANWVRLLAMRPSLDWSSVPLLASLSMTSAGNSFLHAIEALLWGRSVRRVELHPEPVFILGHWRSGTTLVHNLLAQDPQFAFVNLYQTLFPGHFLLTERWVTRLTARFLPAVRPMDNMPCAWDLPQEDETALLLLTLFSPYISVAFPDQPEKYARFANLQSGLSPQELARWKRAFVRLLQKATLRHAGRPLVLKSPPHTVRIPLLRELFPRARYVYVMRDPYEVYASTLRLRRVMARLNGLSRRDPAGLEEEVLDGYMRMYQAYHMHKALLDKSRVHEMRYEHLVADPVQSMQSLYQALEIPDFERLRPALEAGLNQHREYKTRTQPLSADEMQKVYARWQPAFRRYGYPSRLES